MFGIVFTIALAGSTGYALYRVIRDRLRPPIDYSPSVITFADAARLAAHAVHTETAALREHLTGEAGTVRIIAPLRDDGTPAPIEAYDAGAVTVDITRLRRGRHRRADPGCPEAA